jgi:hypothetical protein
MWIVKGGVNMEERPKSAVDFMPAAGSGESPASMTNLMSQIGKETPIVEQEKKIKGMSVLEASGV